MRSVNILKHILHFYNSLIFTDTICVELLIVLVIGKHIHFNIGNIVITYSVFSTHTILNHRFYTFKINMEQLIFR